MLFSPRRCIYILLLLTISLCLFEKCAPSTVEVPLHRIGFNYAMQATLDFQSIPLLNYTKDEVQSIVVDTGHAFLVSRQPRDASDFSSLSSSSHSYLRPADCLYLLLDGTPSNFTGTPSTPSLCYMTNDAQSHVVFRAMTPQAIVAQAEVGAKLANRFQAENHALHNLHKANGTFGLSYCTTSDPQQSSLCFAFRQLLSNSTGGSTTFALDFRPDNGTLYLGNVDTLIASPMVWARGLWGASSSMHQFMMRGLRFGCGNTAKAPLDLLARYGSTWPAVVDTGSTCLSLPAEIYDDFLGWWNPAPSGALEDLPFLSFILADGSVDTSLYIHLADLVVNTSDLMGQGGLLVSSSPSDTRSVCIIRGSSVIDSRGNFFAPTISFGALVLKSLIFSADFTTRSVGFANKVTNISYAEMSTSSADGAGPYCAAPVSCIGAQEADTHRNSCLPPPCSKYFFASLDESSQRCTYHIQSFAVGVVFILLFFVMELTSAALLKKVELDINESRNGNASDGGIEINGSHNDIRSAVSLGSSAGALSKYSLVVIDAIVAIADKFIIDILCWGPADANVPLTRREAMLRAAAALTGNSGGGSGAIGRTTTGASASDGSISDSLPLYTRRHNE